MYVKLTRFFALSLMIKWEEALVAKMYLFTSNEYSEIQPMYFN